MNKRISLVIIFLSALILHDFLTLVLIKAGPLTLTYQRLIIIAFLPMLLLHQKFKFNLNDKFFLGIQIFFFYGFLRISGNYKEFLTLFFPLSTFIILYVLVKKESEIKICIDFLATMFIFFCIIGIVEIYTGIHFVKTYYEYSEGSGVAIGMYANPNDFAAFMTTMMFYMFISRYSLAIKVISTIAAMFIIYVNGSQICLLALLTYSILYLFNKVRNKKVRILVILCSILPIYIIRGVFVQIILKSSLYWRFLMYQSGIQVCKDNLIFGTGIGNYESAMLGLGFVETSSASANPHCLILELAGQFGIIWVLLLIILLIKLMMFVYKSNYKNKFLLGGLLYIYPFVSIASSSCLGKNYTYLALLIPLLLLKREKFKYA